MEILKTLNERVIINVVSFIISLKWLCQTLMGECLTFFIKGLFTLHFFKTISCVCSKTNGAGHLKKKFLRNCRSVS